MENFLKKNNILKQTGFGFTAAALVGAYAICACAALGQSLLPALLCCAVCLFTSLKLKNGIFAPDVYLLVPVIFIFSAGSPAAGFIAIALGGAIYLILQKFTAHIKIPTPVMAGAGIGLALGVTILLTKHYFGIGAFGETPLEMLKNYRYLGFHPLFRGLLYGTITLFTMITYPFKFKKLNKYIPAEFITILLPFILNLFLNPEKELTTINEAICLAPVTNIFSEISMPASGEIPLIMKTALATGLILMGCAPEEKVCFGTANLLSGAVSSLPVKKYNIRGYGFVSAITAFVVISVLILIFPNVLSRIPMHCVGSMLIVSAWQHLPTKALADTFKRPSIIKILAFFICTVAFVVLDIFGAAIVCTLATLTLSRKKEVAK